MPELPEVETVRRDLHTQLVGRTIAGVSRLDWPRMVEQPGVEQFVALLAGRTILDVERRAKWLLLRLDNALTLAFHLRMTGNLFVRPADEAPDAYTHLVLALDGGDQLFFRDIRKFGRVALLDPAGVALLDGRHGPEPLSLSFDAAALGAVLAARRTTLKTALLDQRVVAGLGNIYVDEALWHAGLHPLRRTDSLNPNEVQALHAAIQQVLRASIARGGSTLRDYRNGWGEVGDNQRYFVAYGRGGQPCSRCGSAIERAVVGQRGTHYCPACQTLP